VSINNLRDRPIPPHPKGWGLLGRRVEGIVDGNIKINPLNLIIPPMESSPSRNPWSFWSISQFRSQFCSLICSLMIRLLRSTNAVFTLHPRQDRGLGLLVLFLSDRAGVWHLHKQLELGGANG